VAVRGVCALVASVVTVLSHGTKVASVSDEEEMVECQQCVLGPMDGSVFIGTQKIPLVFFFRNSSLSSVRDECVTSLGRLAGSR
jgi:methylglyoxal synthase